MIGRTRRRREDERGATLVEFTIVAMLLFLLLFGIIEFGLAFRDWLTVSSASRAAARVGSAAGTDPSADILVLEAVEAAMTASDVSSIREVWIYKATDNGGVAGGGTTNRYSPRPGGGCGWAPCPDPDGGFSGYGGGWAPESRNVSVGPGQDLDLLGVRIIFEHEWITGFIGDGVSTWTDDAVMRLEPQQFVP